MHVLLAAAAAEVSEAHAEADKGGLPQLDVATWPSQLFWLALIFGLLYWLMSTHFLPRIGRTIEERRDRIADDLDKAAEQKQKAEDAEKAYKQSLADATAKARAIAAETRAKVNAELAAMTTEADKKAADSIAKAEARIAAMKADASRKVKEAAVETSRSVVAALIDETPTLETAGAVASRVNA
jgi:F-type H+-transporting ATPase subunit b